MTASKENAKMRTAHADSAPRESVRRVALASMVGTSIEWYDFFVFGTASALVFGRLFFPTFSPLAGTLAAFASFAVGFVARPVGGLVFGHIGDRCRLGPRSRLVKNVILAEDVSVGDGSILGGDPQDLKFKGEDSTTTIGDENVIREGVTINKGTMSGGGQTVIGNRNMLMSLAHVAHDCLIEDNCILANACLLAGHVRVESFAILLGWVVVHHFATRDRRIRPVARLRPRLRTSTSPSPRRRYSALT